MATTFYRSAAEMLLELRQVASPPLRDDLGAPLFEFTKSDAEKLTAVCPEDIETEFRLPFRRVCLAIPDAFNIVVSLVDTLENQVGIRSVRLFTVVAPVAQGTLVALGMAGGAENLRAVTEGVREMADAEGKKLETVGVDELDGATDPAGLGKLHIALSAAGFLRNGKLEAEEKMTYHDLVQSMVCDTVTSSFHYLSHLLSPRVAVMENSFGLGERKARKAKAVDRVSRYTLVNLSDARTILRPAVKVQDGERQEREPTLRRGHYKILANKRYARNEDGSARRVWWKSCWVGPEEAVVGQRRYRILLNLDKRAGDPAQEVCAEEELTGGAVTAAGEHRNAELGNACN